MVLLITFTVNVAYSQTVDKFKDIDEVYGMIENWANSTAPGAKEAARNFVGKIENEAEQGNPRAQYLLGRFYSEGKFFSKNQNVAKEWYKKSAEQGFQESQFALAFALWNNSKNESIYWFKQAANAGYSMAQYYLGLLYGKGDGVSKDEELAYYWLLLAAASGNEKAINARDVIERNLTGEQRSAIQSAARKWKPNSTAAGNPPVGGSGSPKNDNISMQPNTTGSGIRVSRELFITNNHVIEGCTQVKVNGVIAKVRNEDPQSDLALLFSTTPGPIASLRSKRASVGETIAVAGFPLRGMLSGFNITTGNLSSLSGIGGDTRLYQISAPVQPGNSGGPMLDAAGNLMGVVVSKLDAIKAAKLTGDIPQNVNFAININVLRGFLDANNVEYDVSTNSNNIPTTVIAEKAKGFTALVECWK